MLFISFSKEKNRKDAEKFWTRKYKTRSLSSLTLSCYIHFIFIPSCMQDSFANFINIWVTASTIYSFISRIQPKCSPKWIDKNSYFLLMVKSHLITVFQVTINRFDVVPFLCTICTGGKWEKKGEKNRIQWQFCMRSNI